MSYQTLNKQIQYPLSGSFTGSFNGTATTASYVAWGNIGGNINNQNDLSGSLSNGNTAFSWGNHANAGYALTSSLAGYVPYIGATTNLNLDTNNLTFTTGRISFGSNSGTSLINFPDANSSTNGINFGNNVLLYQGTSPLLVCASSFAVGASGGLILSSNNIYRNGSGFDFGRYGGGGNLSVYANNTTLAQTIFSSTGNVSIGTTSDLARLAVCGISSTSGLAFLIQNSTPSDLFSVLNNGNVGIGTSSPSQKFQVTGTGNQNVLINSTNSGIARIYFHSTNSAIYVDPVNAGLSFTTGNTLRAFIAQAGNFGIGTSTDFGSGGHTFQLSVSGNIKASRVYCNTFRDETNSNTWAAITGTLPNQTLTFGNGGVSSVYSPYGSFGVGISSGVSATLHVRGNSPTTGTAFLVKNSTPSDLFKVDNSGETTFSNGGFLNVFKGIKVGTYNASSIGMLIQDDSASGGGAQIWMNGAGRIFWGNTGSSFYNNAAPDISLGRHATNTLGLYTTNTGSILGKLILGDNLTIARSSLEIQRIEIIPNDATYSALIKGGGNGKPFYIASWANGGVAEGLYFGTNYTSGLAEVRMAIAVSGNVSVGTVSDLSATLGVRGNSASTGSAFLVQNSTPLDLFTIANNGDISTKGATVTEHFNIGGGIYVNSGGFRVRNSDSKIIIGAYNASIYMTNIGYTASDKTAETLAFTSSDEWDKVGKTGVGIVFLERTTTVNTAVNRIGLLIKSLSSGFVQSSGSITNTSFQISPIINQTGSANGITRGLYINPTLTAAADFRGLEIITGNNAAHTLIKLNNGSTDVFCVKGDNKIGFYGATPTKQGTMGLGVSTYTNNGTVDTDTFDGYTLGQVVLQLRNLGILQ